MIDHFGINCVDFEKAKAFYDKVLGVLGYSRQMDYGLAIHAVRDAASQLSSFIAEVYDER